MFQDQGNHCGHPKLLTKDGLTADLGDHSAWPSRRTSLPVPGRDTSHLLGTLVGRISVGMKPLEEVLLDLLTSEIANRVGRAVSSLGVQEGSRAVMVALPGDLCLLISWPGHRAFSLAGRLSQWNAVVSRWSQTGVLLLGAVLRICRPWLLLSWNSLQKLRSGLNGCKSLSLCVDGPPEE